MIKQLTVIFLLTSQFSFAQFKPQSTQFDKFVNKPGIEWATYASDSFNFDSADFNNLLLNRLQKKEIKASLPVESRTGDVNGIIYLSVDSINHIFHYGYHPNGPIYDSLGNVIQAEQSTPKIDTSTFILTEVTQILFVEKGIFKSYIPWVCPTVPVVTSNGMYIGQELYFNSCYNFKYNSRSQKKSKLLFLKQNSKMLQLDSIKKTDQLKEMYGHNLLETLWPYVLQNKIKVFSIETKGLLKPEELNNGLTFTQGILTPVYDSVGNILRYDNINDPIDPKRFSDVQLVQDWYYDYKKNKVFSDIKEMVLYLHKSNKAEDKEPVPVLRLVFK